MGALIRIRDEPVRQQTVATGGLLMAWRRLNRGSNGSKYACAKVRSGLLARDREKVVGMNKIIGLTVVCGVLSVLPARAQVSEAYLFSTWNSPVNQSVPPFTFSSTGGVRMFLNGSGVATGQVNQASSVSVGINYAFKYLSNSGKVNPGEGFAQNSAAMGARVNSEIGKIDDAGFVNEGATDAPLNLDYCASAKVVFKKVDFVLPYILIAEDAGLDVFKMEWDADGNFNSGAVTLFNGFNSATRTAILNRSDFGTDDMGSDIDQVYLFKFANGLQPGYLRITEIGNIKDSSHKAGTRLELDFVGSKCIPEPTTAVTVGMGISLLGVCLRRRR
jgi:hypothetical protein